MAVSDAEKCEQTQESIYAIVLYVPSPPRYVRSREMRISLLRGVQSSALGGAGAAARARLPLPASCLAALRSRSLLLFVSLFLLFLLGGAFRSRFSSAAYATAAGTTGQTPPDSLPAVSASARDADDDLDSPRPRVWRSSVPIYGGVDDAPGQEKSPDAIELARFAVTEHNSKTNAALEFVRLVKVRTQVVAGLMYYFTVEVREVDGGGGGGAGAYKLYEAKVCLSEWENFKGLHSFEPVSDAD